MTKNTDIFNKNKRKYHPTLQIHFSQSQREKLDSWADGRPIAAYIKDVLFIEERKPQRTHGVILQDKKLYAQALGSLGQSRLASNVNQMAKAVNSGSLQVNQETEAAILEAAKAIIVLRDVFFDAMGLHPPTKGVGANRDT